MTFVYKRHVVRIKTTRSLSVRNGSERVNKRETCGDSCSTFHSEIFERFSENVHNSFEKPLLVSSLNTDSPPLHFSLLFVSKTNSKKSLSVSHKNRECFVEFIVRYGVHEWSVNRLPWLYPETRYSYSPVSLTERIFRVKEKDHISTPCIFANAISYRSCIRFLHSSISLTSLLFNRLCHFGLPAFTQIDYLSLKDDQSLTQTILLLSPFLLSDTSRNHPGLCLIALRMHQPLLSSLLRPTFSLCSTFLILSPILSPVSTISKFIRIIEFSLNAHILAMVSI